MADELEHYYDFCLTSFIITVLFSYAVTIIFLLHLIFTALHAMQTRSSDENSVRLSVRHTRVL